MNRRSSFTLIELLIVLAMVAILSVVVILTLNPSELLKQSRDSTRLSDLSTLNTSLGLFSGDVTGGFMGTSSIVYISIPDTTSTCSTLGLPTLPVGYSYNCATTANFKKTDGTGWIPVTFSQISFGSPLSNLPVDPVNTTTTGNYYTYVSGGGSRILTALPESARQRVAYQNNPSIPNYPGVIGIGSNVSLSPLYNSNGLVGYWKFDGGTSGSISNNQTSGFEDSSGSGNNGTAKNGNGTGMAWTTGKIGGAVSFDGVDDYVALAGPSTSGSSSEYTEMAWVNSSAAPPSVYSDIVAGSNTVELRYQTDGNVVGVVYTTAGYVGTGLSALPLNSWTHFALTYKYSGGVSVENLYKNGVLVSSSGGPNPGYIQSGSVGQVDGSPQYFPAAVDD